LGWTVFGLISVVLRELPWRLWRRGFHLVDRAHGVSVPSGWRSPMACKPISILKPPITQSPSPAAQDEEVQFGVSLQK
jgi:hypothetical protein